MTDDSMIAGVSVAKVASVYCGGKCISHALVMADGSRKTVGVVLPSTITFNTQVREVMEIVEGRCSVRMACDAEWHAFEAGETFDVPEKSSFDVQVMGSPMHFVCHYG